MSNVFEQCINQIDEEIKQLEEDKENFHSDISDINKEISRLLEEKKNIQEKIDNLNNNEEHVMKENIVTQEEVDELVNAVYDNVARQISFGSTALIIANDDLGENPSLEYLEFVTKERTLWLTEKIINLLIDRLEAAEVE